MSSDVLGEFALIEKIRNRASAGSGVCRGIGDDAAELELPEGHRLLTSTDLLIESVHFRFDWTDAKALGHKAVAVNLSDIAAMGGKPRYLYLGLACPKETDAQQLDDFLSGVLAETEQYGVSLVGGDTCSSPGPWMISVTIEGSVAIGQSIGRDGARAGDLLMVSGSVGDSALALKQLKQGLQPEAELLQRHHLPTPRVGLGRSLADAGLASAMIDISDGLIADLKHILRASKLDAVVELDQVPLSDTFSRHCVAAPELLELALYGGEDYELLFSVAPEGKEDILSLGRQLGITITPIGSLQTGNAEVLIRNHAGVLEPVAGAAGYDHFS
ncbi:MAG: thiamine-phosphate kinase [Desulfuromonadales bacterium]|nr:thiamine-phosphate kinase [Desulfuromonadales bacterium]